MVQITKVEVTHDYIIVEYLTNNIIISTRVYHTDELTPQQIVEKGYEELKPHIQIECDRLGILADHELPMDIEDEVIKINLLGIENIFFTEGQPAIEKSYRCAGHTKFGKVIDLSEIAEFTPSKDVVINPTSSSEEIVSVCYNDLTDSKDFTITYRTLTEINEENARIEAERIAAEQAEEERLANMLPPETEMLRDYVLDLDYRMVMIELGL